MLEVKPRGKTLYIMGTHNNERIRKSTGLPVGMEKEAQEKLREFIDGKSNVIKLGPKVEDAVETYLKAQKVGATTETYVRRFSKQYGQRRVGGLDIMKIHDEFISQAKAPETIRREIGAVQSMLNWTSKAHGLGRVYSIPKPRQGEERLRFLERDEVQAMINAAPIYFKPFVVGLFYSGMRRSELAGLVGKDIIKDAFVVSMRKGRHAKVRHRSVPIHKEVAKVLPKDPGPSQPLFVDEFGDPWTKNIARVNKVWAATARRAGVLDCNPHDARRTFASRLLEKGVDLRTIADLLGHTDLQMLMRYAQVRGERKVGVLSTLDF